MLSHKDFVNEADYLKYLRDYMAVKMPGMDADATHNFAKTFNRDPMPETGQTFDWAVWFAKADATVRYMQADAMLAARDAS